MFGKHRKARRSRERAARLTACCPHVPCPLEPHEILSLTIYNGEVQRGVVHSPPMDARMTILQSCYYGWLRDDSDAHNMAQLERLAADGVLPGLGVPHD